MRCASDIDRTLRLTVGLSDALPKLIAYRLLENVLHLPEQVGWSATKANSNRCWVTRHCTSWMSC